MLFTDLFFLKGLLELLQIGQQADVSADLDADGGKEPVQHGRRVCRPSTKFQSSPLDGNKRPGTYPASHHAPCERLLPNWPEWRRSPRQPCGCTSVQSPGRLCVGGETHFTLFLHIYELHYFFYFFNNSLFERGHFSHHSVQLFHLVKFSKNISRIIPPHCSSQARMKCVVVKWTATFTK